MLLLVQKIFSMSEWMNECKHMVFARPYVRLTDITSRHHITELGYASTEAIHLVGQLSMHLSVWLSFRPVNYYRLGLDPSLGIDRPSSSA